MKLGDLVRKYIILIVIYSLTIGVVLYWSSLYKKSLTNVSSEYINDITSSRYDILYDNIYNYSLENNEFMIYVSNNYKNSDEFLFIDSDKISSKNLNRLISDFGYNYNISKDSVPFYIVFKNGKIKEIYHD